jgi:hypothetical protein
MGAYYSHYVIPRDNTLRPTPDQIIALIEAWQKGGYILEKESPPVYKLDAWYGEFRKSPLKVAAQSKPFSFPPEGDSRSALSEPGALIQWRMNDYISLGTVYPLDTLPDPGWRPSYGLEIHLCDDFTNKDTDAYGGSCRQISTHCTCGHDLLYETTGIRFEEHRVRRTCPKCGKLFRPQDQIAEIAIGATGGKYEERGGLCYRFAIVVDCGKEMPQCEDEGGLRDAKAQVGFMETCRSALGIELYEVSYYS